MGEEVSIMRIGTRQLKLRGPRKRNKPLMVIKSKSVPSRTKHWLEVAIRFAKAAIEMRGAELEDVVENIINKCTGQGPLQRNPEIKERRKLARYKQADENVRRMMEELREKAGGEVPATLA